MNSSEDMTMTSRTQVLLLVISVILSVQSDVPSYYDMDGAPALFEQFIKDYNKVYKDDKDKESHFKEFKQYLEVLNNLNEGSYPDTPFNLTEFTDMHKMNPRNVNFLS